VLKKFIILAYLSTVLKLHLSNISGINLFTGYGEGYVMVNRQRHSQNLVVFRDRLMTDWQPASFEGLETEHFRQIAEMEPEIVLLGTGARLRFPRPELTRALFEARIGLEVMDLQAACRTYNILAAEERKVAAALLFH
jgi:uncharacterized protein